ncbi:hypothetical protein DY000_02048887 [Brassica cretica]|uniref:Uncharacterized protein n=1 Tax=Brassica cretica TaxID=69181 RepID=A0ABQ7ESB5_BRACR|nr:hypothetical protein DY000_02048887 [Brassica cretica]
MGRYGGQHVRYGRGDQMGRYGRSDQHDPMEKHGRYKVLRSDSDLSFNGWKNVEMKAPKADITHHASLGPVFGALEAAISKFSILNDDIVGRGAVLVLLLILYKVLRHDSDLNFNVWKNVEMKAPKADITHHALLWLLRSEVIVASLVPLVLISLSFHHILVIRLRCKQVESIESGYVLVWRGGELKWCIWSYVWGIGGSNPQVLHPERRHCRSWSRPCAASDLVLPGLRIRDVILCAGFDKCISQKLLEPMLQGLRTYFSLAAPGNREFIRSFLFKGLSLLC